MKKYLQLLLRNSGIVGAVLLLYYGLFKMVDFLISSGVTVWHFVGVIMFLGMMVHTHYDYKEYEEDRKNDKNIEDES